jgi:hypothetical protein
MRSGERSGASAREPLVVSGDSLRLPGFERMTDVTGETGVLGVTPGVVFVLEAPGDTGLVVVNVREAPPLPDGTAMDRGR